MLPRLLSWSVFYLRRRGRTPGSCFHLSLVADGLRFGAVGVRAAAEEAQTTVTDSQTALGRLAVMSRSDMARRWSVTDPACLRAQRRLQSGRQSPLSKPGQGVGHTGSGLPLPIATKYRQCTGLVQRHTQRPHSIPQLNKPSAKNTKTEVPPGQATPSVLVSFSFVTRRTRGS